VWKPDRISVVAQATYFVRDQHRHSLRERAIIGGQLERADLQTFVDDRYGDRFALLTDGEPSIETVAPREP
jgi:hypothetical protein